MTLDYPYAFVEVVNRDSASDLYFRIDGTDPTVGGDGTYYVGPGGSRIVANPASTASLVVVGVISASPVAYSVTGLTS